MKDETRIRLHDEQLREPNAYGRAMDEALAESPPVIKWELRPGGIRVAVSVDDPHTVKPLKRKKPKQPKAPREPEPEAYEIAERFRKHIADNTPLMRAARTEI